MDLENRAEEAEEAGDLERALQLWQQLAGRGRDPELFFRYGRVAEKLEKWDDAENAFAEALNIDPNFSLAMEAMGSVWFTRSDRGEAESLQSAKKWFLKALKYGRNARALTFLGATCAALEDASAARNAFEEALQIDPNYEEALYNLAKLNKEKDPRKSCDLLEKAIEIDPEYSLAHQELGTLYHGAGDLTRAEYHFRRSLEIDPTDYWSHLFLANLLAVRGKNVEAEQIYRFATSLHPDMKGGLEFFAHFLDSIGKQEEATSLRARMKASGTGHQELGRDVHD